MDISFPDKDTMSIAFGSDFHLEHYERKPQHGQPILLEKVDVLVAAGDIAVGSSAPGYLRKQYGKKARHIVYVPGNHEFYGRDILETQLYIKEACHNNDIVFLDDDNYATIDDLVFVGGTLWTDFNLNGNVSDGLEEARACLTDFRVIRNGDDLLTPEDTVVMHNKTLARIKKTLGNHGPLGDKRTVVVTHHGPSLNSVHDRYVGDGLNPAFNSNLFLEDGWGPDLWIHGHVHDPFDYKIGRTRVVANPRGYPNETYKPEEYVLKIIEL